MSNKSKEYAALTEPNASEVETSNAAARVADTVTVGAWNKPPVIGYGSVYFYAVPAKHPHEWAIRRHGELQPVAFADSTDEAEDLVGLLESTAEYFMELSAQNSIREVDKAGLVAAMIPRALAESIVSHTFTKITPREGAAIYEDACRQALAATREQTAEVTTSDASEPSVSALKETFGGPANCSKCEAPIMAGGSCHNCQKPNPEPGAGPYKRDGKMVEGPETLTPFSTEGDAVRALDLANAAYLAGQASTPEKPGLAVALDRMEKEADKWAKTPTEQTNCISVAAALRIHAEAIRELDKTAANLTPSPVPQGACPECQGPMIEIGMGNDPVCRQSVVTCPTAELAWSAKLTANHTPAVPLSGSVEGELVAADLVHEAILRIETSLMEVDAIENEVGGGIAGLRQAHGVQSGTLNGLRQDLIVVAEALSPDVLGDGQTAPKVEDSVVEVGGERTMDWQPIETAPFDTPLIVRDTHGLVYTGSRCTGFEDRWQEAINDQCLWFWIYAPAPPDRCPACANGQTTPDDMCEDCPDAATQQGASA